MYRLSVIVEEVFRKYLPVAQKVGVPLDLDFPDPTKKIEKPSRVREPLEEHLSSAIRRTKNHVKVLVKKDGITIFDDGSVLSPAVLSALNKPEHIEAQSRVGFGTSVFIRF